MNVLTLTLAAATTATLLLTATDSEARRGPHEGFDGAHCQFISEAKASGQPGRTRPLAVLRWQNQIRANCPEFSAKWWRAKNKYVTCQVARQREFCTAGAAPARKWLR